MVESPPEIEAPKATQSVTVDAALKLTEGNSDEERVLGATLVLRHHAALLADAKNGRGPRQRLRAAVAQEEGAPFLCRLLRSSPPLQRLALGLLRSLLAGPDSEAEEAAQNLRACAGLLVSACSGDGSSSSAFKGDAAKAESPESENRAWGPEELSEAVEVLKRLLDLSAPTEDDSSGSSSLEQECCRFLMLLLPDQPLAGLLAEEAVASSTLGLAQMLLVRHAFLEGAGVERGSTQVATQTQERALALAEAAALESGLRGKAAQRLALGLLAEYLFAGPGERPRPAPENLDKVLSAAMSAGNALRAPMLQLVASGLAAHGLSLGAAKAKGPPLGRLKPLLVLAAGELRLALEGYGSREGLCAACMALEAAIVAFGKEAEVLEESGNLEQVHDCLSELHRALQDVHEYCGDLPASSAEPPPEELALVARLAAAFQLEDPRRFSSELQRSLPPLCRLAPAEFQVLLPCLQEMQDWHLTPALDKVLESAHWGLSAEQAPQSSQVWRQCAVMLAEVALDAAVYLPEAPLPEPPCEQKVSDSKTSARTLAATASSVSATMGVKLPRPLQAADASDAGVRRLCGWSYGLWRTGVSKLSAQGGAPLWELSIMCGALLTSVPEDTLSMWWPQQGLQVDEVWNALAECLFSGSRAEASTWRLAMRLAGFALDRHGALAESLARVAASFGHRELTPPAGAAPEHDDEDEFALADRAAKRVVQAFLAAAKDIPLEVRAPQQSTAGYANEEALDGMD